MRRPGMNPTPKIENLPEAPPEQKLGGLLAPGSMMAVTDDLFFGGEFRHTSRQDLPEGNVDRSLNSAVLKLAKFPDVNELNLVAGQSFPGFNRAQLVDDGRITGLLERPHLLSPWARLTG